MPTGTPPARFYECAQNSAVAQTFNFTGAEADSFRNLRGAKASLFHGNASSPVFVQQPVSRVSRLPFPEISNSSGNFSPSPDITVV